MFLIPNNKVSERRYLTYEQMNLINTVRANNLERVQIGRLMLASLIYDTPCADAVFGRLMQDAQKIHDTFSHYYSAQSAEQVYNLSNQDAIIMRNFALALKAKDYQSATTLLRKWQQNANDQAELFASMNPFWIKEQWQAMLQRYVLLSYQQVLALVAEDCDQALNISDLIHSLTILMADYISRGIMAGLAIETQRNQRVGASGVRIDGIESTKTHCEETNQ